MTNHSEKYIKSIVTGNYIVSNTIEVVFVKTKNNLGWLYGKNNKILFRLTGFDELSFITNGFIKINSSTYINSHHITAINLKTKDIELAESIYLRYNDNCENTLQQYLDTLS